MVQIIIKKTPSSENLNIQEWSIIELQGDLESKNQLPFAGKFIGDLFYTKKNVPVLIIGHHILYGKCMELEKPLAVLKKQSSTLHKEEDDIPQTEYTNDKPVNKEYGIKAVIKKKIIFKTRPKPIIANIPKKV